MSHLEKTVDTKVNCLENTVDKKVDNFEKAVVIMEPETETSASSIRKYHQDKIT